MMKRCVDIIMGLLVISGILFSFVGGSGEYGLDSGIELDIRYNSFEEKFELVDYGISLGSFYEDMYARDKGDVIEVKYLDYDVRVYEINSSRGVGVEYEAVFYNRPRSNIVEIVLFDSGYEYYYQDRLDVYEYPKGYYGNSTHIYNGSGVLMKFRSEDIIDSYAVYDGNVKVCHIPRSYVVDSKGLREWCKNNISDGVWSVEVSWEYLDSCVYPISVFPSIFGFDSLGGSHSAFADDTLIGCKFQISENGVSDSITMYITNGTLQTSTSFAIYDTSLNLLNRTEIISPSDNSWNTAEFDEGWEVELSSGVSYYLVGYIMLFDKGYYYDSGDANQGFWDYNVWESGNPPFPNPAVAGGYMNEKISIYCNYTASGGDGESPIGSSPIYNCSLAGNVSDLSSSWSDNVGLSGYIFGSNNSGVWVNDTWTNSGFSGVSDYCNKSITLNSTIGIVVQWNYYVNDTSDNWGVLGLQNLTTTVDVNNAPILSNGDETSHLAGNSSTFSCDVVDDYGLSGYIWGTNNSGVWVNDTWSGDLSGLSDSVSEVVTLNSTVGVRVEWQVWANDTSNLWGTLTKQYFITTVQSEGELADLNFVLSIMALGVAVLSLLVGSLRR